MARTGRSPRLTIATVLLCCAVSGPPADAAELGELTEPPGKAACMSADGFVDGEPVCTKLSALDGARAVVVSPDGRFAYVQNGAASISVLARDSESGLFAELDGAPFCLVALAASGCTDVRLLGMSPEGTSLAMTRDGAFLYVGGDTGIAAFRRDVATGALTQLDGEAGCLSASVDEDGNDSCADAHAVSRVYAIALSPDQRFAYVNFRSDDPVDAGLAILARDPATGALTQLEGKDGCASTDGDDGVGVLTCLDIRGGGWANGVALTPDGEHLYLPSYDDDTIAVLDVDTATGKLSQADGPAGCISADGSSEDGADTCEAAGTLTAPWNAIAAQDGQTLYVSNWVEGLAAFRIDEATGALTPLPGAAHCITNDGSSTLGPDTCQVGRAMPNLEVPTLSADGRSLYYGSGYGVIAFRLDPATGEPTQMPGPGGCWIGASAEMIDGCASLKAFYQTQSVALSPDQAFLYAAGGEIAVLSRQAPPICRDTRGATPFATPFALALPCSDPNGDPITREVVGGPSHGILGNFDQRAGTVRYAPSGGFSGSDTFSFRAVDAASASAAATAEVTVGAAAVLPPPPPPDRAAPVCQRLRPGRLSLGRLRVRLRCGEAAELSARLTLGRRVAKRLKLGTARRVTLARGQASAAAGAATVLRLEPTRKARKRLGSLKRLRLRALRPRLAVTAVDASGNTGVVRTRVKLKR